MGFQTRLLTIVQRGPSGLLKRADDANSWPADLFLSVHHDSVQPQYFKTWLFGAKVRPYSDEFRGYSVFVSKKNGVPEQSWRFADAVANRLMQIGMSFTTHHAEPIEGEGRAWLDPSRGIYQFDELSVLRRTKMPAVLLEAGVIVNREEELELASPTRHDAIAKAITAAVMDFCESASIEFQ